MNIFKCDVCGKETYIDPPRGEQIFDEVIKNIDGKKEVIKKPRMTKMLVQNYQTGLVEEKAVPVFKDLGERCYIVALKIGDERVQRDFCKDCLKEYKEKLKDVFMFLANLDSK